MMDFLKWIGASDSVVVDLCATVLVFAAIVAVVAATIYAIVAGYGVLALGLWVAIPLWVLTSLYKGGR